MSIVFVDDLAVDEWVADGADVDPTKCAVQVVGADVICVDVEDREESALFSRDDSEVEERGRVTGSVLLRCDEEP